MSCQYIYLRSREETGQTLTYAVVHLVAVLLQVVLDAALEEVQLGLQLLGEAEHAVLVAGQVGVVAQQTQPGIKGESAQGRLMAGVAVF